MTDVSFSRTLSNCVIRVKRSAFMESDLTKIVRFGKEHEFLYETLIDKEDFSDFRHALQSASGIKSGKVRLSWSYLLSLIISFLLANTRTVPLPSKARQEPVQNQDHQEPLQNLTRTPARHCDAGVLHPGPPHQPLLRHPLEEEEID